MFGVSSSCLNLGQRHSQGGELVNYRAAGQGGRVGWVLVMIRPVRRQIQVHHWRNVTGLTGGLRRGQRALVAGVIDLTLTSLGVALGLGPSSGLVALGLGPPNPGGLVGLIILGAPGLVTGGLGPRAASLA